MSNSISRRDLFKRAATATAAAAGLGTGIVAQKAAAINPDVPMLETVPKKVLGATGEKIPILLMGGEFPFDPNFDKMLHRAFKDGMTYIDTAETYANGKSLIGVGAFQAQVGRENVWITSKAGLWGDASASRPERFSEALTKSLAVLKTDYVNMFFMHGVSDPKQIDEPWIKMGQQLKKDGKTKHFGFSCHDGTVVELLNRAAAIGSAGVDAVMFKYSFAQYGDLELNKAMDACIKSGIGLIGMKTQDSVPQDKEEVQKFVSDKGFSLPQAKLKSVWADERISSCVSGIVNTKILKDNSDAAKSQVELTARDWSRLQRYAARTADHRCALCNTICQAKVDGPLRISDTLRYLMYDECYEQPGTARALYARLRPEERHFEHIDLTAATAACPRGIDIRARLALAKSRLA